MKIGILSDVNKVAKIVASRPEVFNVFVEGSDLIIESENIGSVVDFLEDEHGLHLIDNGGSYMVASRINEAVVPGEEPTMSLSQRAAAKAGQVAKAGAMAAKKAVRAGVRGTTDRLQEKQMEKDRQRRGVTGTMKPDEMKKQAEIDAKNLSNKGQKKVANGITKNFIELAEIAKNMSPDQLATAVDKNPDLQRLLKNPKFVELINKTSASVINKKPTTGGQKPGQGDFVQIPKDLLGL